MWVIYGDKVENYKNKFKRIEISPSALVIAIIFERTHFYTECQSTNCISNLILKGPVFVTKQDTNTVVPTVYRYYIQFIIVVDIINCRARTQVFVLFRVKLFYFYLYIYFEMNTFILETQLRNIAIVCEWSIFYFQ